MPKTEFTPVELRELARLPNLETLDPDVLVALTVKQLSLMSTVPTGSVTWALARAGITPAVPNSNAYRVEDLRVFCAKHRGNTGRKLAASFGNDSQGALEAAELTRKTLKDLLAQAED